MGHARTLARKRTKLPVIEDGKITGWGDLPAKPPRAKRGKPHRRIIETINSLDGRLEYTFHATKEPRLVRIAQ